MDLLRQVVLYECCLFCQTIKPTDQSSISAAGDHVVKLMSQSSTVILVLSVCKNFLVLICLAWWYQKIRERCSKDLEKINIWRGKWHLRMLKRWFKCQTLSYLSKPGLLQKVLYRMCSLEPVRAYSVFLLSVKAVLIVWHMLDCLFLVIAWL